MHDEKWHRRLIDMRDGGSFPVEVGRFLGPSIERLDAAEPDLPGLWRRAGIEDVRVRHMSFGAGLVMWGARGGGSPA